MKATYSAPLTREYIDKKTPIPAAGYTIHWDTAPRGFGLRVNAGGKRTFIAVGRVNGRVVWHTVGSFDKLALDDARKRAKKVLSDMEHGIDPRVVKKEAEATQVTLRQVADSYYRDRTLKDSSKGEIERHLTTTFSSWLNRPIANINREMVTTRFNTIRATGTTGRGPAPAQANQGFSILRALINYAIREHRKPDGTRIIADNPTDVLYGKWTKLKPRKGRIPDNKLGAVYAYLADTRANAYNRDTWSSIDLVTFLLLTGCRIAEGSELTWDRVNLDEGWWHLPDPKNSNPVWLPLATQAVELLKQRPRVKANNFVFPSWGKSGHLKDPRDTMKRVSEIAGEKQIPHNLRRTFTTIGVAACGIEIAKMELLTNHVPKGVTANHYLETSKLQYLRPQVQQIADHIEHKGDIARAQASGANVVELRVSNVG
jgi:integrase